LLTGQVGCLTVSCPFSCQSLHAVCCVQHP
jgi:hypothetical protein